MKDPTVKTMDVIHRVTKSKKGEIFLVTVFVDEKYTRFIDNKTELKFTIEKAEYIPSVILKLENSILERYNSELREIRRLNESLVNKLNYDLEYLRHVKEQLLGDTLYEAKYATSLSMSPDAPPYSPPLLH